MKISIAMASYNGEKYIQQQLDSFISQTRQPDQLVVCDDCSTDNTVAIIEKFSISAPFEVIVVRNPKNLGFTRNFEKSLMLCTGDLVFLSDQDDFWYSTKLEVIERCFVADSNINVITNNVMVTGDSLDETNAFIINAKTRPHTVVKGCSTSARSTWLKSILPISSSFATHDRWINDISDLCGVRRLVPEVLQKHRRHKSNASVQRVNKLLLHKRVSILEALTAEINYTEEYLKKIESIRPDILDNLKKIAGLRQVSVRLDNLNARLKIVKSKNVFLRVPHALYLYFRHGYKYASGAKSMIRDVVGR